jgi:cytochrome c-type biogenesis protein CcmH/NrfG
VTNEPSSGELARRLEAVHQDLKEDLRDIAGRLDHKVSTEVFKLEQAAQDRAQQALVERVAAIEERHRRQEQRREEERQAAAAQRASDRRLLFTALIAPVLIVLLTAYLATKGAGS